MGAEGSEFVDEGANVEDAPFDFDHAFDNVKGKPCRVDQISITGLDRTKPYIVSREFARVREAKTLDDVKDAVLDAYEDLMGLDIFEAIEIVIDGSRKGGHNCNVVARFYERSILRVHTGTYVQGTEGSVEASANLTNPLGRAEQISLSGEWGSQSTTTYSLGLTRPRPFNSRTVFEARLQQSFHDYQRWSSFSELVRGGSLTLSTEDGRHSVSYDLGWRRLTDSSRQASRSVVRQLGDKLKSAVRYAFRYDAFEERLFPRRGWGVSSTSELAGVGVDPNMLRFFRQRLAAQIAVPLSATASFSLTAEAGALLPWGAGGLAARPSSLSDRFFPGGLGATPLRGFRQKGVGPSDARRPEEASPPAATGRDGEVPRPDEVAPAPRPGRDALGGDFFGTILASLSFELPFELAREAGMHGHIFLNGGSVVGVAGREGGLRDRAREFKQSLRWTAGAGIVWPTRVGRLELNACRVLVRHEHDRAKHGLQFGFAPPAF